MAKFFGVAECAGWNITFVVMNHSVGYKEEKTIASEQLFHDKPYFGENPGVFKYQVVGGKDNVEQIFRLHFYIGCRVTALLVGDGDG